MGASGSGAPAPRPDRPGLVVRGLHLAALSGLAIAQPLFAILEPEFFTLFAAEPIDVVALAVGVALLPPLILLLLEAAAQLAGPRVSWALHLAFVATLVALLASQALLKTFAPDGPVHVFVAGVAGAAAAMAYRRWVPLRAVLTVLSPAPVVFVLIFLFASPVHGMLTSTKARPDVAVPPGAPPVVLVVLDELPTTSLLDERGRIDARRLPNLAAIAQDSTWFRNATTVHTHTPESLPAIETGVRTEEGSAATASENPNSIFTLLGDDYRFVAAEPATDVCPQAICHESPYASFARRMRVIGESSGRALARAILPDVVTRRLGMDTPFRILDSEAEVRALTERVGADDPRSFYFLHLVMPHQPWRFLPSGRAYAPRGLVLGLAGIDQWSSDPWVAGTGFRQHVLQLGYADRLLGRLFRALRRAGVYDRALVVVTADHGVGLQPGGHLRLAQRRNLNGIMSVPLFVKLPGQRAARVNDRFVRTVDLLPTIADVLGVRIPWRVEGNSVFSSTPTPTTLDIITTPGWHRQELSPAAFVRRQRAAHQLQRRLFPLGLDDPELFAGPQAQLVGRALDELELIGGRASAVVEPPGLRRHHDPRSGTAPTLLTGRAEGVRRGAVLAAAVNGVVRATTHTYLAGGETGFTMLIPESSLEPGINEIALFRAPRSKRPRTLVPLTE